MLTYSCRSNGDEPANIINQPQPVNVNNQPQPAVDEPAIFPVQPTVQIALGLNAGNGEGEEAGFSETEEQAFKQLGRAGCRLAGVFSPMARVIQAGVNWELAREARLGAIFGFPLPPGVVVVTKNELQAITPLL